MSSIVWFRRDLRLEDNPALRAAASDGPVIPVFVLSDEAEGGWPMGAASRWWLHHSLASLSADLEERGGALILRTGTVLDQLRDLAEATGAKRIVWNRRYEPDVIEHDKALKAALKDDGLTAESFGDRVLFEPWDSLKADDTPYKVFTPYWRAMLGRDTPDEPASKPRGLEVLDADVDRVDLDDLALLPTIPWADEFPEHWTPGESGARAALRRAIRGAIGDYAEGRDRPDDVGTSRLSPHLHFGEVSPRRVWHDVKRAIDDGKVDEENGEAYLRQLGWRDFSNQLLYHFPTTQHEPLREEFGRFPWREDESARRAWERGQTGYPIVDAGMRELWRTGWMHNRVRMVVASFLVKDLLIPWQEGAAWFWDTLVDADLANNTMGWQWTAGCGADAAPYFRVFNPTSQGERWDPDGTYVRRWVPEIEALPDRWIHRPWEAPADVLREAGVTLGEDYPEPIVDHSLARDKALAAYDKIRAAK